MRASLTKKQKRALGENIRSQRDLLLVTQSELAKSLRVKPVCVYQWEQGVSNPSIAMLVRVADRLSCSTDRLLARV